MKHRSQQKAGVSVLESELRRLRRRDQLLSEAERFTHSGSFEWHVGSRQFVAWSDNFIRIFNIAIEQNSRPKQLREQMIARIHIDDRERYLMQIDAAHDFSDLNVEFRVRDDSGESRFLRQLGVRNSVDEHGAPYVIGILQDVTAQMISDADPLHSESLVQQAEKISELGSFIYDDYDDVYLYASPGCARIHGVSEAEFVANVESVADDLADVHADDRPWVETEYRKYFNSGDDCSLEYRIIRPSGEERWIRELMVASLLRPNGKVALTCGVMQDITRQKTIEMELRKAKQDLEVLVTERTQQLANTVTRLEEEIIEREKISAELEFLANHDPLTGLPSSRLCQDRLERALADARRTKRVAAVMFLDLDGFKSINDNFSHEYGDMVLKTTANRICGEIRETDTAARIGGDEFLVILSGLPDFTIAKRIAGNLLQQVAQPITIRGIEVKVGVSIGIALYPDDAANADELIRVADKLMYSVKQSGKNDFCFSQSGQPV